MTPYECPRVADPCGELHGGCVAHNREGRPCGAQVMRGTGDRPRCRSHLGQSPVLVTAQYQAERQAMALFRDQEQTARAYGVDLVNPLTALHELADEIVRWKEVCRAMVGQLEEIRYRSGKSGEQVRAEIVLYERSMERAGRILVEITRLGIEDRLARLDERAGDAIVRVIEGTLLALGIDSGDRKVAALVESQLRLIQAEESEREGVR